MKSAVDSESRRLLARIHRSFQTRTEVVRFSAALTIPFTRIADPDRVLDEVAAEADRRDRVSGTRTSSEQLHLPYWAELWDSSLGVGQYLCANWQDLVAPNAAGATKVISVLDLGCGMGLAGCAAAALGASVLFVDLEPPALLFARLNTLRWGRNARTRQLNWQTDRLDEKFDLILGADILYERAQWEFLEPFWRAHLAPNGAILLGEPGRQTGDLFLPWIRERHWSLEQSAHAVPTRDRPIRLFTLRALKP